MPLPIALAHRLSRKLAAVRKNGPLGYLRPDGKTQVTIQYEGTTPIRLDTVVLSTQHAAHIDEGTAAARHPRACHRRGAGRAGARAWTPPTSDSWSTRPGSSSSAGRWATLA